MDHDEVSAPPIDPLLFGLWRQLRALEEQHALMAVDDDGSLAQAAQMLALKRGCRR